MSTTTNDQAGVLDAEVQKILDDLLSVDLHVKLEGRENQLTPKSPLLRPLLKALFGLSPNRWEDSDRSDRISRALEYILSIASDSDCVWFAPMIVHLSKDFPDLSLKSVFRPKTDLASYEQDIIQGVLPCLRDGSDHSLFILNKMCKAHHGAFTSGQLDMTLKIVFESPMTIPIWSRSDDVLDFLEQREYKLRMWYFLPLVPHLSSPHWHMLNKSMLRLLPLSLEALSALTEKHPVDQLDCEWLVLECLNRPFYESDTMVNITRLLKGQKTFASRLLCKISSLAVDFIEDVEMYDYRCEQLMGELARLHHSVEWKVRLLDFMIFDIYFKSTDDFSASFLNLLKVPNWPQECFPPDIRSSFMYRVMVNAQKRGAPEVFERLCKEHAVNEASFLDVFSRDLKYCPYRSNNGPLLSMIRSVINTPAFAEHLAVPDSLFWQRVDPILVELREKSQLSSQAGVFGECARLGSSIDRI